MRRMLLVGFVLVPLCGCTGRWVQEGKGYIESKQDAGACADRILAERRELNPDSMRECMEAKGYRHSSGQQAKTDGGSRRPESPPPKELTPPAGVEAPKTEVAP